MNPSNALGTQQDSMAQADTRRHSSAMHSLSSYVIGNSKESVDLATPQISPFGHSPGSENHLGQPDPGDSPLKEQDADDAADPKVLLKSSLLDHSKNSLGVSDWNEKVIWETRQTNQAQVSTDPPRDAREGYEWVWFPDGYWAERQRVEKHPKIKISKPKWFNRAPQNEGSISSTVPSTLSPSNRLLTSTSFDSRPQESILDVRHISDAGSYDSQSSKIAQSLKYISPTYPHFKSPSGEPEGLYCKTKRGLGVKSTPKSVVVRIHLTCGAFA